MISPTVTYEDFAREYYDPLRHPTSANFREASCALLAQSLKECPGEHDWICEVGAGKSMVAELLSGWGCSLDRLLVSDVAPSMLNYSARWDTEGAHLLLADATSLPLRSRSIGVLIASLGDPYNGKAFWREAYRVLCPGGVAQFTVPAHDWARSYRRRSDAEQGCAEFELVDGRIVAVPSFIYSEDEQCDLMKSSGFSVKEIVQFTIGELHSLYLSPKLLKEERGARAPVVTGYIVTKPASIWLGTEALGS